jgi:anti-anti-sigma regulatory factor
MTTTGEVRLDLPEDFGIEHAAALRALLAQHVDAATVELGGASVHRLHTAGLQLLASFITTRAAAGHATRWRDPSPELRGAAARLGLDTVLGIVPSRP